VTRKVTVVEAGYAGTLRAAVGLPLATATKAPASCFTWTVAWLSATVGVSAMLVVPNGSVAV